MTRTLENKTALITGGTSGIGLATAKLFRDEGASVLVTGRSEKTIEAAREELGDSVRIIQSDAGDTTAVKALFATIAKDHDRIDVLFINAGIARFAPIALLDEETFDNLLTVNFRGPFFALQSALPLLKKGSSVVFTTSVADRTGLPGASAYGASKAALRSLVRTAAAELSGQGIRVNALSPGPIETPIFSKMGLSETEISGFAEEVLRKVPLGRFGQPSEIANAALFLASDASSYIQGTEIEVDGGLAQV